MTGTLGRMAASKPPGSPRPRGTGGSGGRPQGRAGAPRSGQGRSGDGSPSGRRATGRPARPGAARPGGSGSAGGRTDRTGRTDRSSRSGGTGYGHGDSDQRGGASRGQAGGRSRPDDHGGESAGYGRDRVRPRMEARRPPGGRARPAPANRVGRRAVTFPTGAGHRRIASPSVSTTDGPPDRRSSARDGGASPAGGRARCGPNREQGGPRFARSAPWIAHPVRRVRGRAVGQNRQSPPGSCSGPEKLRPPPTARCRPRPSWRRTSPTSWHRRPARTGTISGPESASGWRPASVLRA